MFEYVFLIPIPWRPKGASVTEPHIAVAEYSFDPGVKVGELITVSNWNWGGIAINPSVL